MDIKHDYFTDEAEVLAEIEAAGYHAVPLEFGAETNPAHWHDFHALVYVTGGELTVTNEETGERCTCVRGSRINATRGVLHSEETSGYSATVGIPVAIERLTQPIDKPPPVSL